MSILLLLYGPGEVVEVPAPEVAAAAAIPGPGGALAYADQPRHKRLPPYIVLPDYREREDEEIVILWL